MSVIPLDYNSVSDFRKKLDNIGRFEFFAFTLICILSVINLPVIINIIRTFTSDYEFGFKNIKRYYLSVFHSLSSSLILVVIHILIFLLVVYFIAPFISRFIHKYSQVSFLIGIFGLFILWIGFIVISEIAVEISNALKFNRELYIDFNFKEDILTVVIIFLMSIPFGLVLTNRIKNKIKILLF